MPNSPWLIIGLGNPFRNDDGAGWLVAQRLRALELPGATVVESDADGAALMEIWKGVEPVIVIDAAHAGAPPGTIHKLDARAQNIPARLFGHSSTHAIVLAAAVELARTLNQLPTRLLIYGIEGENFGPGQSLSPAILRAVDQVVEQIRQQVASAGAV
jgi:hydrogenase maturation protease